MLAVEGIDTVTQVTRVVHGTTGSCAGALPGATCSITEGRGAVTGYGYTNGHLTSVTPPASNTPLTPIGATTIAYDNESRVRSTVDGKGQRTCYSYEGNSWVTEVRDSSCASATKITYTYDKAGNFVTRVDNTGTTVFTFDALNRPTAKQVGTLRRVRRLRTRTRT